MGEMGTVVTGGAAFMTTRPASDSGIEGGILPHAKLLEDVQKPSSLKGKSTST